MSFASAADHQASSAIVSKQTLMSKIFTQSHFVQMLQTVPVSSNFEVIIMFTRQFAIDPWVNDKYFSFIKILLQQLAWVGAGQKNFFSKDGYTPQEAMLKR